MKAKCCLLALLVFLGLLFNEVFANVENTEHKYSELMVSILVSLGSMALAFIWVLQSRATIILLLAVVFVLFSALSTSFCVFLLGKFTVEGVIALVLAVYTLKVISHLYLKSGYHECADTKKKVQKFYISSLLYMVTMLVFLFLRVV